MKVLGLFSGIGGFELGFERAGFQIAAMCEIDPWARRVLAKHWPTVPVFEDVRELTREHLERANALPEVITGGFPCQDISMAGKGAGLKGKRSGLWAEFLRLIRETQPKWVIVENVASLRVRGLEQVLSQLAEIGYDSEWHCIPASAVGAPHQRDRVWLVARPFRQSGNVPNPECRRPQRAKHQEARQGAPSRGRQSPNSDWWACEPNVCRVAHGLPLRVDRVRALGNAVVPQIPQIIAEAIREVEGF